MLTTTRLISPAQLRAVALPSWVRDAADEFERRLCADETPFPCHFARIGLRRDAIRFTFVEDANDPDSLDSLADSMRAFVACAPAIAGHTSLVAFVAQPREHDETAAYHAWFWQLLGELRRRDRSPWPTTVPSQPEHAEWEFCFAGMTLFALGAGPTYRVRASRHTNVITLAFQPRFVFDRAFATRAHYDRACARIRARVTRYDGGQPVHPALGAYGDPDTREWRQYVVPDTNDIEWGVCPLTAHH